RRVAHGDPDAANHLFAAAWPELSRLTAWHLREHPDHALRSEALLNELYGELFAGEPVSWQNRAHFFKVASGQLRRVLIDHARTCAVGKRDGGRLRLSLTEANGLDYRAKKIWSISTRHCTASIRARHASSSYDFFGDLTERNLP